MKKIVLTFGIIAGLICGGMFYLSIPKEGEPMNFDGGAWVGYVTMIIALSSIFFAVKQYRDKYLDGHIDFKKSFLIGLYITLVASVVYVVAWEAYYRNFAPDFADQYLAYQKTQLAEQGMSEAEITSELATQEESMQTYQENTAFRLAITFTEIFPVGLIISLICALIFGIFLKTQPQEVHV